MKRKILYAVLGLQLVLSACDNDNNDSGPDSRLETVFTDSTYQFTGIAKEEGGRLFINYPRWSPIYQYAVVTAQGASGKTPYPDLVTNQWDSLAQNGANRWVCVQSVYVDKGGSIWVLDPAAPYLKTVQGNSVKLVKMNRNTNLPERTYFLRSAITDTSYVNDVRIDTGRQYAYMTDSKTGGIVVLNLQTGAVRQVLRAHPSTLSDPAYQFVIDGRILVKEGKPAKFNSDGIALTPDGNYLYYKPLTDDKLYRIKTEYLRNASLTDAQLGSNVEDLGHFNTTDGMIFDQAGNLYMGDLQRYEIVKLDTALRKTVLARDRRLIWPDSYVIADGYLYVTCSQINMQPEYNNGINMRSTPYQVFRIKL